MVHIYVRTSIELIQVQVSTITEPVVAPFSNGPQFTKSHVLQHGKVFDLWSGGGDTESPLRRLIAKATLKEFFAHITY